MKVMYVCSPLGGDIPHNVQRVKEAVTVLIQEAKDMSHVCTSVPMPMFLVPHFVLNNISFTDDGEVDRQWGLDMCLTLLGFCDSMTVIGDNHTPGMVTEINYAREKGIPIIVREDL